MKHHTHPFIIAASLVLLTATFIATAQTPPKGAEKSGPGPAGPPEELKVLAPMVGKWGTESVIGASTRNKESFTSKGEMTGQWMHNGHFLVLSAFAQSALGRFESTSVIWFDRRLGKFRQSAFSSDGTAAQSVGQWDAATKTMAWKGVDLPEGWTASSTVKLDGNVVQFIALVKNEKGEVLRDVRSTSKRIVEIGAASEPAKTKTEPPKKE